jgi:hypothetical protein
MERMCVMTIRERMSLGHLYLTLKVDVMTVGVMKSETPSPLYARIDGGMVTRS